jgi:hypothetical protein
MENKPYIKDDDTDINMEIEGSMDINPKQHINRAIIKAQDALIKDDVKAGFLQYRILVEHIETLCKSAEYIDQEYINEIKSFQDSEEFKSEGDGIVKSIKLANKKLGMLMEVFFNAQPITSPLKL